MYACSELLRIVSMLGCVITISSSGPEICSFQKSIKVILNP